MKLWGGRFETGPSEVFERFSGSLDFDRRLIDADIRGSQAFARALEHVGILTADERAQIVEAFEQIRQEARAPDFYEGAADEDVHTLVIRKLKERAGPVADKIHTGRSRNEQVSLDTRLWLREECDRARQLLCGLMGALLDLAAREYPATRPSRSFVNGTSQAGSLEVVGGRYSCHPSANDRDRWRRIDSAGGSSFANANEPKAANGKGCF